MNRKRISRIGENRWGYRPGTPGHRPPCGAATDLRICRWH